MFSPEYLCFYGTNFSSYSNFQIIQKKGGGIDVLNFINHYNTNLKIK